MDERSLNPRSASAKLRAAERTTGAVSVAAPAPRTAAPRRRAARSAAPAPQARDRPTRRPPRAALSGAGDVGGAAGGAVRRDRGAERRRPARHHRRQPRGIARPQSLKEQNTALASEVAAMSGYGRIAVKASKLGMVLAQPARSDYIPFARQAAHPATRRPARNSHAAGQGPGRPAVNRISDQPAAAAGGAFRDRLRSGRRAGDQDPGRRRPPADERGPGAAAGHRADPGQPGGDLRPQRQAGRPADRAPSG